MNFWDDRRVRGSLTDDWDGTGAEPADTAVTINHPGMGSVACQLSGTFVGTVTFEVSVNGTDYVAIQATALASGALATTATAGGIFLIPAVGMSYVRARCSAFTSGPIEVILLATPCVFVNANYTV
jgi:hypothetical protein